MFELEIVITFVGPVEFDDIILVFTVIEEFDNVIVIESTPWL